MHGQPSLPTTHAHLKASEPQGGLAFPHTQVVPQPSSFHQGKGRRNTDPVQEPCPGSTSRTSSLKFPRSLTQRHSLSSPQDHQLCHRLGTPLWTSLTTSWTSFWYLCPASPVTSTPEKLCLSPASPAQELLPHGANVRTNGSTGCAASCPRINLHHNPRAGVLSPRRVILFQISAYAGSEDISGQISPAVWKKQ